MFKANFYVGKLNVESSKNEVDDFLPLAHQRLE